MTDLFYGSLSACELALDIRELSARLGDPTVSSEDNLAQYIKAVRDAAQPVFAILCAELSASDGVLSFAGVETDSKGLSKLTEGCGSVLLCAMTLGAGVDRLIAKEMARSASDGFFTDAVSDAMAEALADKVSLIAKERYSLVTGRFSPGYGDLPLSVSADILKLTDAERRLGIKTAKGGLMIPKKSITAIIGVKSIK